MFRGQAFLDHFVFQNIHPYRSEETLLGLGFFALILFVPLLISLEYLRKRRDRLLLTYLICAFGLALVTVARAGADTNFFLECVMICCVLSSAYYVENLGEPGRAPELLALFVVTLFVGLWGRMSTPSHRISAMTRACRHISPGNIPAGRGLFAIFPGMSFERVFRFLSPT
jgi:hypothetical protein